MGKNLWVWTDLLRSTKSSRCFSEIGHRHILPSKVCLTPSGMVRGSVEIVTLPFLKWRPAIMCFVGVATRRGGFFSCFELQQSWPPYGAKLAIGHKRPLPEDSRVLLFIWTMNKRFMIVVKYSAVCILTHATFQYILRLANLACSPPPQ